MRSILPFLCLLLVVSACSEVSEGDPELAAEEWAGLKLSGLAWKFSWATDGIEFEQQGWSTTNSEGVMFRIDSGWLSSYSTALAPCETEEELEWAQRSVAERVLGIGIARADHGVEIDPSALATPLLEDLTGLAAIASPPLFFDSTAYCQLHYLVARADPETTDPAPGIPMSLVTLRLDGQWSVGQETGELLVESSFNHGALFDLKGLASPPSSGQALIELRRNAGALFEGIDPRTMSENQLAWQLTENLVGSTELLFEGADFSDSM